jgi:hypothetical protein
MGITQSMFEERENELSASAPGASAAMTCARVSFVEDIPGSLECAVCREVRFSQSCLFFLYPQRELDLSCLFMCVFSDTQKKATKDVYCDASEFIL